MRKLMSCLVISLGLMAGVAQADVAKMYIGGGFSDGSAEVAGEEDMSLGTLSATLGFQLLDFVGIEFEIGAGSDQSDSVLSDSLVTYQAAMLRLGYRWDRTAVYLLGGQAHMDNDVNSSSAGNVFGFGVNLFGNEHLAINFHALNIDDGAFTTATIGVQYYFGGFR